jgi:hypothetical protein
LYARASSAQYRKSADRAHLDWSVASSATADTSRTARRTGTRTLYARPGRTRYHKPIFRVIGGQHQVRGVIKEQERYQSTDYYLIEVQEWTEIRTIASAISD